MIDKIQESLGRLNLLFDLENLGAGSVAAGANILATKALVIANLSAAKLSIKGRTASPGTSFTLTGARTQALSDEALRLPLQLQANYAQQVKTTHAAMKRERTTTKDIRHFDPERLDPLPRFPEVLCLVQDGSLFSSPVSLMRPAENHRLLEMFTRPLMAVRIHKASEITKCQPFANFGRLFIQTTIIDQTHGASLAPPMINAVTGWYVGEPEFTTVHSQFAAIVAPATFVKCMADGHTAAWLGRSVWLADGECAAPATCDNPALKPVNPHACYSEALQRVMAERTDPNPAKTIEKINIGNPEVYEAYLKWLADQDKESPGIMEAASNLPSSLIYGIYRMFETPPAKEHHKSMPITFIDVTNLARWIVLRMLEVRRQLHVLGRDQKVSHRACKILRLLDEGPADVRSLTRRCYKLNTGDCVEALRMLEQDGFVKQQDDLWLAIRHSSEYTRNSNERAIIEI